MLLPSNRCESDKALDRLSVKERLQLQDFLRVSTRKATSARAVERQLLLSLNFANRNVNRAC